MACAMVSQMHRTLRTDPEFNQVSKKSGSNAERVANLTSGEVEDLFKDSGDSRGWLNCNKSTYG